MPKVSLATEKEACKSEQNRTYLEKPRRLDAAAPVAGSCASLWACSSPRSRCRAQPAPWLWCCRTCCVKLWTAGYVYRCSLFQRLISPGTQILMFQGDFFFFILCRAPTFPTERTPPQPASPLCRLAGSGSDLSIAYVSPREGGPKLEEQTRIPHVACFTRGKKNKCQTKIFMHISPFEHTSWDLDCFILKALHTICKKKWTYSQNVKKIM